MIKWSEFVEGGVRFEAFLPEHEREAHAWILRASARGHVLDERSVPLTWPPRFGPDRDDVVVLEAAVEEQIIDVAKMDVPEQSGSYTPGECVATPPNPIVHAVHFALLEQFAKAEAELGLTREKSAAYLVLAGDAAAGEIYPFAITPDRGNRLRRAVVLASLLASDERVACRRQELIDATLRDDRIALAEILTACGVDPDAPTNPA